MSSVNTTLTPVGGNDPTSSSGSNGAPPPPTPEELREIARRAEAEAALLGQLQELITSFIPTALSPQANRGIIDSPLGQPHIAPPVKCSLEELANFVSELTHKGAMERLQTDRGAIVSKQQEAERYQTRQDQLKIERDKQAQEASKNENSSNILKWFKRIAGPLAAVASVALTAATAGAASPLLALTIAMTAVQMADQISQEAGGPSLSIADGLAQGFSKAAQEWGGMDKEQADNLGKVLSGALMIGASLVSIKSLSSSGSSISTMLKLAKDPALRNKVIAHLAPRLAAPLAVALDPKFAGNMAAGAAGLDGRMSAEDIAILNASITAATQLAVGVGMGRATIGAASKAATAADAVADVSTQAARASRLVAGASAGQAVITTSSGATGTANSVLELEMEKASEVVEQLGLDIQSLTVAANATQQDVQWLLDLVQKIQAYLSEIETQQSENSEALHQARAGQIQNIGA